MVKEFLETKRNIQANFLRDRLGDIEMKREFTKVFSPIIESQQKVGEKTEKAISNVAQAIPSIEKPKTLAIEERTVSSTKEPNLEIYGSIARDYLMRYLGKTTGDTIFGVYTKGNKLFIGNQEVKIILNDIIIDNQKFEGSTCLWELITSKDPKNYSEDDLSKYARILIYTDAMYRNYDSSQNRPNSSKSDKWKNIVKPIWDDKQKRLFQGIIPIKRPLTDKEDKLLERYLILLESKQSGNTSVNDEMFSIIEKVKNSDYLDSDVIELMESQAEAVVE